jgi:DNA-binding FadR family transcriptional regulator
MIPRPVDRKPRKNEIVAAEIRDYILEHGLRPGDRLPTEDEFADLFGVSRVSVREATRGLAMLGVLDSAPRRGLTVGSVDIEKVSHYIGFHLAMGDYPLESLIDTRVIIETGGLEHVARRMQEDESIYAALNKLNSALRETRQAARWIRLDRDFHRTLVSATGLAPLSAFNKIVHLFFDRFRGDFPKDQWALGVEAHQRVIDCLRANDWQRASDELRKHIESHRARIITTSA